MFLSAMGPRYLEDHGDRLVVRATFEDRLARGAVSAFVLAPLVLAASSAAAWVVADGDSAFLTGWALGAFGAGIVATYGFVVLATARQHSARRVVRIDLAERVIARPNRGPEVLRDIEAVRIRAGRWPWSALVLEFAHSDGRATPLLAVPRRRGRDLARVAEELAGALGAPARILPAAAHASSLAPRDPRTAAALCSVPVDGFAQAVSVFYLMSTTDPFVRFHAKQSLSLTAVELVSTLALATLVGVPLAFAAPDEMRSIAFAFPLVVFAAARAVVRTIAALRAYRGLVWIQPWLAPITRRWAPSR
jgi:hypothetical protein